MSKEDLINKIQREIWRREQILQAHIEEKSWVNATRVQSELWGMNYILGLVKSEGE